MNRRSFLQSILAAGVAPAFVGSSILMPVRKLWVPPQVMKFAAHVYDDGVVLSDAELFDRLNQSMAQHMAASLPDAIFTMVPDSFEKIKLPDRLEYAVRLKYMVSQRA